MHLYVYSLCEMNHFDRLSDRTRIERLAERHGIYGCAVAVFGAVSQCDTLSWFDLTRALLSGYRQVGIARAQPLGGRGIRTPKIFTDPQHFYWPQHFYCPPTLDSFLHGGVGLSLYIAIKWIIPRFTFQLYCRLNDLKFKIPKKFPWKGSPSPLHRPLPAPFSGFSLNSGFALKLDFTRFGPPYFWSMGAPLRNRWCLRALLKAGKVLVLW